MIKFTIEGIRKREDEVEVISNGRIIGEKSIVLIEMVDLLNCLHEFDNETFGKAFDIFVNDINGGEDDD